MFLILTIGEGSVTSICNQLLVPILAVSVYIPCGVGSLWFSMILRETKNWYFENQTQQSENNAKPITNISLFPVYDLVLNLIHRLCPPYDNLCMTFPFHMHLNDSWLSRLCCTIKTSAPVTWLRSWKFLGGITLGSDNITHWYAL